MDMRDEAIDLGKEKPKARGAGGYLFIPKRLQTSAVILWLRRMHAWTGIYGALFFLCLGLSGFYLNHRAQLKIEGGRMREVASLSMVVEQGVISTEEELAAWVGEKLKITTPPVKARAREGERVAFDGRVADQPKTLEASFRSANALIEASHEVGTNVVRLKRQDASVIKLLTQLHKGAGVNKAYILIVDSIAGALIFMSLSGVLLWTRLHGSRILAVGIMGALVVATMTALSGSWLSWTLP
ncbi:MAG: hypothetical protein A3E78_10675 [Alphaproteobacteria bacterium RIFCSPHIGHO2_12_FULL_63_12]|nr:MAG: hypothetical protein A3E78_10675 [Alphaproteobacteria bacterium RIFCSPHIGHO2_12_FULL_63_12]